MPMFRRVKIQATVESEPLLLPDNGVDAALHALEEKLHGLDLSIVSLKPVEPPPGEPSEATGDDAWSVRGQPVE